MASDFSELSRGKCQSQGPFRPAEASLSNHTAAAEWFRDAKLGIYFTWGPYTVAAHGNEWYPRWMNYDMTKEDWEGHTPGYHKDLLRWHTNRFGHLSEFGYHDMVPLFIAEQFDPEEWAELFQMAGARLASPCAMHHDGYALWDSDTTHWNATDTGPKRDITGELAVALRKRGIKLVTTFHHAPAPALQGDELRRGKRKIRPLRSISRFLKSHYPWIKGLATASEYPNLRLLYSNVPEEGWLPDFGLPV